MKDLLFLQPVFKDMIWGGNRLHTEVSYDIQGEHPGGFW